MVDSSKVSQIGLNCPACDIPLDELSAQIPINGNGIVCDSCGSIIDTAPSGWQIIHRFQEGRPTWPLKRDARVLIKKQEYTCLGFTSHALQSGENLLRISLLSDDRTLFLLESLNGHFTLYSYPIETPDEEGIIGDYSIITPTSATVNGKNFRFVNRENCSLNNARGIISYSANIGDEFELSRFVNASSILLNEKCSQTSKWFLGEYIPRSEISFVASADKEQFQPFFGEEALDFVAHQTNPWSKSVTSFTSLSVASILIMTLFHLICAPSDSTYLFRHPFVYDSRFPNGSAMTTPLFTIPNSYWLGGGTNLLVELESESLALPSSELILEEVKDGNSINSHSVVSEAPSLTPSMNRHKHFLKILSEREANHRHHYLFNNLKSGDYRVRVKFAEGSSHLSLALSARHSISTISNVVFGAALLLITPICCAIAFMFVEKRRKFPA